MRETYLATAAVAERLLADPAVAEAWNERSALAEFSVKGLAGHLARQITAVPGVLAAPPSAGPTVVLLDHYTRSRWVGADLDSEINVQVRQGGEAEAGDDPAQLSARVSAALAKLREVLPTQPSGRTVYLPWAQWSLSVEDYLATRVLELCIHCDDLAVSVGVPTPPLPEDAVDTVVSLLARVAVRRHGATAVLRALSRAERAPATITAI